MTVVFLMILFMAAAFVVEYISNPWFSSAVKAIMASTYYAWPRVELGVAKPALLQPSAQQPLMFPMAYVVWPGSFAASLVIPLLWV